MAMDPELVDAATRRMIAAGFPGSDPPGADAAAGLQLLGLAVTGVSFLSAVVSASEPTRARFVEQATQAAERASLISMRRALMTLIGG